MDLFRRFSRPSSSPSKPPAVPDPFPQPPSWTHNRDHNSPSIQGAQGTASPIGWPSGPPILGATKGAGHSRPGNPLRLDGYDRGYTGGFRPPGNTNSPSVGDNSVTDTSSFSSRVSQVSPTSILLDESRNWFCALDQDSDGELSFEELYNGLLNNRGSRFSINTVKYLVSVFDENGDGVIGFEEFTLLWNYLSEWQRLFQAFDNDRDGMIDTADFGRALAHYGLRVSPNVLEMVVKKYGVLPSRNRQPGYGGVLARPEMDLDRFICACVVVRQMGSLYDKCSAREISKDEFFTAIISLP